MLEILRAASYERALLIERLGAVLDASGVLARLRERGRRVLLKPNFVMPAPRGDASTTHPDFYMSVAELLLGAGFEVGIGESPAFGSCADALARHGVLEECRRRGVRVVEFRTPRTIPGLPEERHYRNLSVAAELDEWDSLLNLPKVKTHRQFVFTGATKNLYGCVVGKRKFIRHNLCGNDPRRFARMILANAAAVDCVAHVGDGIDALHVLGPRGGEPYPLGAVIVSDDPLAHDWALCHLIALDHGDTPLFEVVPGSEQERLREACREPLEQCGLAPAADFRHAPLIHISFSPWAVLRSGYRTLRYKLAG